MQANVIGRVRNISLAKGQGLLPLFEAIINSIDAIEEVGSGFENGSVDIAILRKETLFSDQVKADSRFHDPIYGFEITDNGIGFTEKNYEAFNEADTQQKASKGGKGVGRFLWLKAFDQVEIDSVWMDTQNNWMRRKFTFSIQAPGGISDYSLEPIIGASKRQTVVRLLGFKEEYENLAPQSANKIAQKIIEHCLEYFVLGKIPDVFIRDVEEEPVINLVKLYDELVSQAKTDTVEIEGHRFCITHFFLHARSDLNHHISFCANQRVVVTKGLSGRISNLPSTLSADNGEEPFIYGGYVSSDYLDGRVNQQRTDFETSPDGGIKFPGELTWNAIEEPIIATTKDLLQPYTEVVRTQKEERIREYVNEQAPQYRHILKNYPNKLDQIPPSISDDKLDSELHQIERQVDSELREKASEIIQDQISPPTAAEDTYEKYWEQFSRFLEEWNDAGKSKLAEYIAHRKTILTILEKTLERQISRKYSLEEVIHQIIFPIRETSDNISYDQHNLWIIDEKLSYHYYLSSDIPLKKVEAIESDSNLRPDLLIFDHPIAVVDAEVPYGSIVIFEFKRPLRDNYYDERDNPIDQVLDYIRAIKQGKALDRKGRPIPVSEKTPFYCYVICDITATIRTRAENTNLQLTPDEMGFFGYNTKLGAYIEIISFDKLVSDSKKRNRILFDKLNIPNNMPGSGN